jgi:integrase
VLRGRESTNPAPGAGTRPAAARRANLRHVGVHVLRHTFCSHLSMRGAPVRAIQELAGHQELGTTQRYMHLSPAAIEGAIRLLDQRGAVCGVGNSLETGRSEAENHRN